MGLIRVLLDHGLVVDAFGTAGAEIRKPPVKFKTGMAPRERRRAPQGLSSVSASLLFTDATAMLLSDSPLRGRESVASESPRPCTLHFEDVAPTPPSKETVGGDADADAEDEYAIASAFALQLEAEATAEFEADEIELAQKGYVQRTFLTDGGLTFDDDKEEEEEEDEEDENEEEEEEFHSNDNDLRHCSFGDDTLDVDEVLADAEEGCSKTDEDKDGVETTSNSMERTTYGNKMTPTESTSQSKPYNEVVSFLLFSVGGRHVFFPTVGPCILFPFAESLTSPLPLLSSPFASFSFSFGRSVGFLCDATDRSFPAAGHGKAAGS